MITISINGESREVPDGLTLQALLEWLKLPGDRVAVERNLEIVPRARWGDTTVLAGDRLEVVHFVGGGSQASGPHRRGCRWERGLPARTGCGQDRRAPRQIQFEGLPVWKTRLRGLTLRVYVAGPTPV